ncbi:Protein TusC [Candidatus Profftia lariciata]|uniref:sulfurtransferase complex subunit TusC n=1 Tax=Candidatus Profftia lariciata TaxID=1987921 RepID=UPI001D017448|nr:sulfurtransferase complex subunit TusC [Candidatus Profftia lariciata]UDG81577.1 Protein TusC [Candidatus Profftia lariciata]
MKRLAFVFIQSPYTTSAGREGLDTLLAASAFCKDIRVFFIGDSILQLLPDQKPDKILYYNYTATFAVMPLYDIVDIYICLESLYERGLQDYKHWITKVKIRNAKQIRQDLEKCNVVLTF